MPSSHTSDMNTAQADTDSGQTRTMSSPSPAPSVVNGSPSMAPKGRSATPALSLISSPPTAQARDKDEGSGQPASPVEHVEQAPTQTQGQPWPHQGHMSSMTDSPNAPHHSNQEPKQPYQQHQHQHQHPYRQHQPSQTQAQAPSVPPQYQQQNMAVSPISNTSSRSTDYRPQDRPWPPPPPQEPRYWQHPPDQGDVAPNDHNHDRYRPQSPPHSSMSQHNGRSPVWSRPPSPPAHASHLSFTRHGSALRPRSPPPAPFSYPHPQEHRPPPFGPPLAQISPRAAPNSLHLSPHSPSYPTKRHHGASDSEDSDPERHGRRHGQKGDNRGTSPGWSDRGSGHVSSYKYLSAGTKAPLYPSSSKGDPSLANASSAHPEGLPALAPKPHRHPGDKDEEGYSPSKQPYPRQNHVSPSSHPIKMEPGSRSLASTPSIAQYRIQSARGTPKGPLPIDVQISLLTSVLQHDPFNCAIRKTTQAWESISREQGIRARTCSRRFDNIIQASIGGRDRPVGTEEQQATKKKLLEQLFEMMNQPQALKRMQKKRRYRSEDTDRRLLSETIRLNPFGQKVGQVAKAWEDVRDALKMKVHARQCIRRVNRMVKPYQLRERMYKGNIPDDMKEANDDLVKQVIHLMRMAGGGSLDDACNSNASSHEDSHSGMSDSEDDSYMDGRTKGHSRTQTSVALQEDDELEDDDDEGMASPADARSSASGQPVPSAATDSPPVHPRTPSAAWPTPGPASAPATPAKRGRPRNPQSGLATTQPTANDQDVHMRDLAADGSHPALRPSEPSSQRQRIWEELAFSRQGGFTQTQDGHPGRPAHPSAGASSLSPSLYPANSTAGLPNGRSEDPMAVDSGYSVHGSAFQSTPLSSPLAPHPSARNHAQEPHPSRRYPMSGHDERATPYSRPIKHARTGSGVKHEITELLLERPRHGSPHLAHGYAQATSQSPRDSVVDGYGRRAHPPYSEGSDAGAMSPPTAQQYRALVDELHGMKDYLARVDEQRRMDAERQSSMMYTIEKLQHQLQQQQHQLSQLQHPPRFNHGPPPPPHHPPPPHQQQQGPPQSGRYPPSFHPEGSPFVHGVHGDKRWEAEKEREGEQHHYQARHRGH